MQRHFSRSYRFLFLASVVSLLPVVVSAQTPTVPPPPTPPATPTPVPVVETPDYPDAVWEPASPANFQPSQRPSLMLPIDRIVIHDIEGSAISAVRWFQNPKAVASSHYVVDGTTGRIYQMIKERDIAWHAGDRPTNFRSVGIEHEGFAYRPGFFNPLEYEVSARLVRSIALRYNIDRDRTHIIGHFEVPDTAHPGHFGGRSGHTDPGPYWDWDYFMALVRNDARLETPGPVLPVPETPVPVLPVVLHPGETINVTFNLTNTGDDPWLSDLKAQPSPELRQAGPVYLGTWASGALRGPNSGFYGGGWISPIFAISSAGSDTAPGTVGRFVLPLHAPLTMLGTLNETFRLYKVPVAPHLPVPFGPTLSVSARIEPYDITVSLPVMPPDGWTLKTNTDGSRLFWHKATAKQTSAPVHWETNLPVEGKWDVYITYTSGKGRTSSALYRLPSATEAVDKVAKTVDKSVDNSSVPLVVKIDQRTGGKLWRKLGRFRFVRTVTKAPGVRPGATQPEPPPIPGVVELLPDGKEGSIITAGDIRFVGPFP